jgi:hypothetical protein
MKLSSPCAALVLLAVAASARADEPSVTIAIRGAQFVPSEVEIPANVKVRLAVRNENQAASEFESIELHREKVVAAGQEIAVYVGPLQPGRYEFFDDFHPQARGHLVVK